MILSTLNLADLATTLYALRIGLEEINPIAARIIGIHPALYGTVKIAAMPLCLWLERNGSRWSRWAVVAAYAITVANNIINIAAAMGGN